MYIREDVAKLRRRRLITAIWAAVMLAVMLICLYRIDAVCKMQVDTLDQVMAIRIDLPDYVSKPLDGVSNQPVSVSNLTASDYELICRVVAAEARGEGYMGQLAVAQVIRDRSQLWDLTPCEVVTAKGQFARPYQGEISAETQAAVNDCLVLGESAFPGPVTHFCEVSVTPYWAAGKEVAGVIGDHRFYR